MRKTIALLVMISLVTPAMADDLFPPDYRGLPLSYQAEWDQFTNGTFGTGIYTDYENSVDDTDPATNLHTGFSTHLDFDPTPGWTLIPAQGGGFYNPTANATFVANVVNWIDWEPLKELRVQVTYTDGGFGAPAITAVLGYDVPTGGPYVGSWVGGGTGFGPQGQYYFEDWIIVPNPDWEQIQFSLPMGTIVEQLVIDSVSPEPASIGLLALGGLALLRRRRRK